MEINNITPDKCIIYMTEFADFHGYPDERKVINHVLNLLQAEADGRLVVLKCAADATIWRPCGKDIILSRLDGFEINDDGEKHWLCGDEVFCEDDFGKTVFLTYAEAEAALKGGED